MPDKDGVPFLSEVSEAERKRIVDGNMEFLSVIEGKIDQRCGNCKWPIQINREWDYKDIEHGWKICATCHDLRSALMSTLNSYLKPGDHFRKAHEDWKREQRERRKNMGLDNV